MKRVAKSRSWFFRYLTLFVVLNLVDFRTARIIARLHTFKGKFDCSSICKQQQEMKQEMLLAPLQRMIT